MKESVDLIKLYYVIEDPYHTVTQINSIDITPQTFGTLATQWPNIFWEELSVSGQTAHCSSAVLGESSILTLDRGSNDLYTVQGIPFIPIPVGPSNIFGPHPTVVFKPR